MIGDGHGNDMMRNMAQNVGMLEHEMELEEGKKVTKRERKIGRIVAGILFAALLIFFLVVFIRY
ncbi:MAG: hypothetical protein MR425_11295, partial [Lachnospiraceae bacterium]|nr:hypothetical protein [Lachnospiraceae bacterium]